LAGIDPIVRQQLDAVDWHRLRTITGSASGVPEAFRRLLEATSDAEADDAYWKLDNRVVVQGQLFDSAPRLVPVLLAALAHVASAVATIYVLDLLVEILDGEADQSEVARGNADLGAEARRAAREGVWLAHHLASSPEASVRERALMIVHAIDPDHDRSAALIGVARGDADERVRRIAAELAARGERSR
jgi:hypothetical protein